MSEKVKRITDNYMNGMYHGHPVKNDIHTLLIEIEALKAERDELVDGNHDYNERLILMEKENKTLTTQLRVAKEALKLVDRFGYGVNVEKNMVIRNTADVVTAALTKIESITKKESGE